MSLWLLIAFLVGALVGWIGGFAHGFSEAVIRRAAVTRSIGHTKRG